MVAADRTFLRPRTYRQLLFRILADIIAVALSLVTWLAEMGVAPAEPLGGRTTVFAFEFDEVFAMFRAVFDWDIAAVRTD